MNHLQHQLDLGPAELFPLAREAVLTWKLQESAGVIARPVRRVHIGQIIHLRLNPIWPAPPRRWRGRDLSIPVGTCEVVDVIDTERAAGFAYRTLPGHLESGEQTFLVSIGPEGFIGPEGSTGPEGSAGPEERLGVSITSDSVPENPLLKAFAPLSVAAQKMMAARYAEGLKQILRSAEVPRQ